MAYPYLCNEWSMNDGDNDLMRDYPPSRSYIIDFIYNSSCNPISLEYKKAGLSQPAFFNEDAYFISSRLPDPCKH